MTLRAKLVALVSLLAVGAIIYAAWHYHVEQLGAAIVRAADARAALAAKELELEQIQRDAKTNSEAVDALQAERDRLSAALAEQPAPVVRVCAAPARGGLPTAAGAPGKPSEAAAARGSGASVPTGVEPGPDIGPGLRLIATVSDRLAAQERALLERERELSKE